MQGRDPKQDQLGKFMCGLAAGAIAKMGTHPLDVAKKRFQVGAGFLQAESAFSCAARLDPCEPLCPKHRGSGAIGHCFLD